MKSFREHAGIWSWQRVCGLLTWPTSCAILESDIAFAHRLWVLIRVLGIRYSAECELSVLSYPDLKYFRPECVTLYSLCVVCSPSIRSILIQKKTGWMSSSSKQRAKVWWWGNGEFSVNYYSRGQSSCFWFTQCNPYLWNLLLSLSIVL